MSSKSPRAMAVQGFRSQRYPPPSRVFWIDPATGRKVKREKHCETRKEAERALADMVAAQARGLLTDPKAPDPLGRMRLQEVKPVHVRAAVDRVVEAGYAPRTVGRVLMRLKALFREALRLELVARNPAEAVKVRLPKGRRRPGPWSPRR